MKRRSALLGSALLVGSLATAGVATADHKSAKSHKMATYEVTVDNTTVGQPLSPPLIAIHRAGSDLWSPGEVANHAVAAIAEDANNAVAIELAQHIRGIRSAVTGVANGASGPAPIGPGGSQTYTVTAPMDGSRISLLTMLVNTNDAFTGLDTRTLPYKVGSMRTFHARAYDAGSEKNNEMAKYIPGPIGGNPFVRDPEGNVIRMHPGVKGGYDLDPVVHSVDGKVVTITVKRVK